MSKIATGGHAFLTLRISGDACLIGREDSEMRPEFYIPDPLEISPIDAPTFTREEHRQRVERALATCPDLGDDEAVMRHLFMLGLETTQIDGGLASMIDEARAARKGFGS